MSGVAVAEAATEEEAGGVLVVTAVVAGVAVVMVVLALVAGLVVMFVVVAEVVAVAFEVMPARPRERGGGGRGLLGVSAQIKLDDAMQSSPTNQTSIFKRR